MTLQTSGPIALLDVRNEYGGTAPDSLCEYSPCIGITAGSTVSLYDFYGKSAGPAIGDFLCGGYYIGVYCGYYLLVSPANTIVDRCWGPTTTCTSATSAFNGYLNTRSYLNSSTYPAAYYTATRTTNGYSDWYLPAINEYSVIVTNQYDLPGDQYYCCSNFWASTQYNLGCAWAKPMMQAGNSFSDFKNYVKKVRAIRRTVL